MKYRKIPVEIEAYQITDNLPYWAKEAINHGIITYTPQSHTLEGTFCAAYGDWVIKGIKNELYSCKKDIFKNTYEKVEDAPIKKTNPKYKNISIYDLMGQS